MMSAVVRTWLLLVVVDVDRVDEWDVVVTEVLLVLLHHVAKMFVSFVLRCLQDDLWLLCSMSNLMLK